VAQSVRARHHAVRPPRGGVACRILGILRLSCRPMMTGEITKALATARGPPAEPSGTPRAGSGGVEAAGGEWHGAAGETRREPDGVGDRVGLWRGELRNRKGLIILLTRRGIC